MTDWKTFQYKDYCNLKNEITNLPNGVNISTMTASIKDTKLVFNFINIYNYLELNENDILAVVRNENEYRSLVNIKKKKKKNDKKRRGNFSINYL